MLHFDKCAHTSNRPPNTHLRTRVHHGGKPKAVMGRKKQLGNSFNDKSYIFVWSGLGVLMKAFYFTILWYDTISLQIQEQEEKIM